MPEITIKNFKGVNFLEGNWANSFAKYVMGIDVFGLKDNNSKLSIPGVLQCMKSMSAGTEAASPNNVTDIVVRFAYYPTTGVVSGISAAASPRLYHRTGGTWTRINDGGAGNPTLVSTSGGGGMAVFGGSLWISQNTVVSRQNGAYGAGWTATFGTFTTGGATPRPMKVLGPNLFIGNDRYISKIDSTPTFTANALTLPADMVVKSLEVVGDKLYITADNTFSSKLYIWDGTSTTYENALDILGEPVAPYIIYADGSLWLIGIDPGNNASSNIYTFNGAVFQKIMTLPIVVQQNMDAVAVYKSGILIAGEGSTVYEDGVGGIWYIGRADSSQSYQVVLAFNPSSGVTNVGVGGIYAGPYSSTTTSTGIYIGTNNGSSSAKEIFETLTTNDTNASGIWQSLPIDGGHPAKNKVWHGIWLDSELDIDTARTVTIKYRLDYSTGSFTTLKAVTNAVGPKKYFHIGRTGKVIEIRLELDSGATTARSTRVHGFTLSYDLVNQ